ncbi:hypothetical protein [Dyadobacter frigoris]|uniref:Outer membrane protein beta-barrel domain-containing protein n=1 Tax=Dyadobacter frigoris TaxID=2576211 RepID=A0A4U6DAQ9_9BACT|nr:hypothetical protein [Dyadobacter frigoris]TKT93936.1 hypothetical protein FDK13_01620 [Dyadobacter frigoris]GLU50847.1 hypothetical protein Dfri01_03080 [Dyadobacter frigoris]
MKNLLVKFTFLMCLTSTGYAQDEDKGKSQIAISAGILPTEDIANEMLVRFVDLFFPSHQHVSVDNVSVFGSYKYFVSEKIAIGGTIGYNSRAKPFNYDNWNRRYDGIKVVTLAGEGSFYYLKGPNVGLYALGGMGCFIVTSGNYNNNYSDYTNFGLTLQLTPLGIRFGRKFGGFAEIGYGYKGLVNMGINLKL